MPRLDEPLVYCPVQDKIVPKSQKIRGEAAKRSDLAAPMVVSDYLGNQLIHPATGARTDSKAHFRQMTRAAGCVEVGDQAPVKTAVTPKLGSKAERVGAIKQAMQQHGVDVL